jgi:ribosome maturation protein Sdo1
MKKLITVLLLFGVGIMTFAQSDIVVKKIDSVASIAIQAVPVAVQVAKKVAEPGVNPVEKYGGISLIILGFIGHFFVKTKWASITQYAEVILQNVLDLVKAINSTNKGPEPKPITEAKTEITPDIKSTETTPAANA